MEYANINEIKNLSIDHTSRCNLACPQCARADNSILPMGELTLDDYKLFIPPIVNTLEGILYCGNFGDAIVSNTLVPVLEWLYNESGFKGWVHIITNGSARSTEWWTALAHIAPGHISVAFSIDGLADTNHLYRVNSNFEKIMANAKAFIQAGGVANWDCLVFRHNEHQVDDIIKLAKEIGFSNITIKQTNRFVSESQYKDDTTQLIPTEIVKTRAGEHVIEIPNKKEYEGTGKTQYQSIVEKHGSWNNYINATHITCKMKVKNSIFIDFESRLWACTWTAAGIYLEGKNNLQRQEVCKILDVYGWDFNSLRHHSLAEVLSHEYYKEKLCASWTGKTSDAIPKLQTCGRTCGTEFEFSSGYIASSNSKIPTNKNNQQIKLK
jgi:MoaA/NifB/PqqE/SkfB family radical SAM enzyme